jgi:XTP/dITP diphosphohydrolase
MDLIFATNNNGKLKEVKNIFHDTKFNILSLADIGFKEDIEETATTFEGNAFIKADTIFEKYSIPVIADDSGLIVEQLNGEPGVYSARYAGNNVTYTDNNNKILKNLEYFPQPHLAKFLCCAVFVNGKKRFSVIGELPGQIINEFKGEHGFGYDPIFIPKGFEVTLAEMKLELKNKISHRAIAFQKLREELEALI